MNYAHVSIYILLIGLGSFIMVEAVKAFIDSSTALAKHFRISNYTISFLLVSLATSIPDVVVAVDAALKGSSDLAYGGVVGASINLLTIVPALTILLIGDLSTRKTFSSKDIHFALIFSIMAQGLALDKTISRIDGLILAGSYVVYMLAFMEKSSPIESLFQRFHESHLAKKTLILFASIGIILYVSDGIVSSAMHLSKLLNINMLVTGLIFTSIGTCLPDLAFSIASAKYHKDDAIMGNIIGSIIALNTLVLGIAALIRPINIPDTVTVAISTVFIAMGTSLFFWFTSSNRRIDKKEAAMLMILYLVFLGRGLIM